MTLVSSTLNVDWVAGSCVNSLVGLNHEEVKA